MQCRFCGHQDLNSFVDLGLSPLSNSYVSSENENLGETFHPLHVRWCPECLLVQLPAVEKPENIFTVYDYFSSYSESWLKHCKEYTDMMLDRLQLDQHSLVIELASNDGYLLQYFEQRGIPVLGIEPAKQIAETARKKNIPTIDRFFSENLAQELKETHPKADLLIGNNVLAHVPELNDFVAGMKIILNTNGVITMEFPHLWQLVSQNQFDTIYHEHFSYFSFLTVNQVFKEHGLKIFNVDELPTHGGSLRIYACHSENDRKVNDKVENLLQFEISKGMNQIDFYSNFSSKVEDIKRQTLRFLIEQKSLGKKIIGYGAAAKGNTLLNYCGIRMDFFDCVVDRNPHKQGKLLPGSRIPIRNPEIVFEEKPDYLFILPWNISEEIRHQMAGIREWGGKFVVPVPELRILD